LRNLRQKTTNKGNGCEIAKILKNDLLKTCAVKLRNDEELWSFIKENSHVQSWMGGDQTLLG